jgi:putative DNA primase/helicase
LGVDIDLCRDPRTGQIAEWAREIILELNSYTEVSPSETGLKIFVFGCLPAGARHKTAYVTGQIECYSDKRFFAVTDRHLEGTPATIEQRQEELVALHQRIFTQSKRERHALGPSTSLSLSDSELIDKAMHAGNGEKFRWLWNGHWKHEYPSQSEADLALCSI